MDRLDIAQLSDSIKIKSQWFLDKASKQGLRTLLMGIRIVTKEEVDKFLSDIATAEEDLINRERLVE